MTTFQKVLRNLRPWSKSRRTKDTRFDIISALLVEISTSLFRMLDPTSMFAAMRVSRRWNELYRSDHPLRRELRRKVIERRARKMAFILQIVTCL